MEKIKISKGTTRDYVPVEFKGEKLAVHDPSHHDATTGTERTLYRTENGDLILHTYEWTRWQGQDSEKRVEKVTKEGLKSNYPKLYTMAFDETLDLDSVI